MGPRRVVKIMKIEVDLPIFNELIDHGKESFTKR